MLAAGAAYVWYTGNQPAPKSTAAAPETSTIPVIKHTKPAANVPVSVSVQSLTTPLTAGDTADITIRTLPHANCSITVSYNKEKVPAKAEGLVPAKADEFGIASWQWIVDPAAPKGKWPVTVTCKKNKRSAVVVADLTVKIP